MIEFFLTYIKRKSLRFVDLKPIEKCAIIAIQKMKPKDIFDGL
jgi:hypothetical protein